MKTFSIEEAIKFGWQTTKANLKFVIGLFIIIALINIVLSMFSGKGYADPNGGSFIFSIFQTVVQLIVTLGLTKILLDLTENKKPNLKDLYLQYPKAFKYFLANILSILIIVGGLILLIVPGIIFAIKLQFITYLIIEKDLGPIEAIKTSWKMTKGQTWNLFLFGFVSFFINFIGALLLLIGLFITIPTTSLASAYIYKKLSSK